MTDSVRRTPPTSTASFAGRSRRTARHLPLPAGAGPGCKRVHFSYSRGVSGDVGSSGAVIWRNPCAELHQWIVGDRGCDIGRVVSPSSGGRYELCIVSQRDRDHWDEYHWNYQDDDERRLHVSARCVFRDCAPCAAFKMTTFPLRFMKFYGSVLVGEYGSDC